MNKKTNTIINIQIFKRFPIYPINSKWKENNVLSFSINSTSKKDLVKKVNDLLLFCSRSDLSGKQPYVKEIIKDGKTIYQCKTNLANT